MVESALVELRERGHEILGAVMLGGQEKLPPEGVTAYGDVTVKVGEDAREVLFSELIRLAPDAVLDLSDEPVLDYRRRFEMAGIALYAGIPYEGADFQLRPPPQPLLAQRPSIAITGTGKRTGKTAVAGFAARTLKEEGFRPVIVAMGRGGPPEPEVLHGDDLELTATDLLELAAAGKHAASDYVEDALLGRVATVGCRRCGGGLAGGVDISNLAQGVEVANGLPGDLLIFEGSGSAIPPAKADLSGLILPASLPEEYLIGYLGTFRLLLADFVVVTMCEEPFGSPSKVSSLSSLVHDSWQASREGTPAEKIRLVRTVFRPTPIRSVEGASVFVATTAPEAAGDVLRGHLEAVHGCRVVGLSHSLSDRARLKDELRSLGGRADILLCEIKAAAIDVAARMAGEQGLEVVFMDNTPVAIDDEDLADVMRWAARTATERFTGSR
ncbi:MAG: 2,3-diphosphoglycerate synthetase [Actinomycetota bacterium]